MYTYPCPPARSGLPADLNCSPNPRSDLSRYELVIHVCGEQVSQPGKRITRAIEEAQSDILRMTSTAISEMTNPSCLLYGPFDARYEDRPIPKIEDPYDVIVRVAYTGVCGSDVHNPLPRYPSQPSNNPQVHFWLHGGVKNRVSKENPITMGHEASGTIHAVGSSVSILHPGDHVALEPGYACRRCTPCKAGKYNLCPRMRFAGSPPLGHGTLTKFFKLPADYCFKIPAGTLGLDEAALMEPLAVAVHSVREVRVRPRGRVLVFGAGTVGLFCAAVAREFGAGTVVSVDVNREKLGFAEEVMHREGFTYGTFVPEKGTAPEDVAAAILQRFLPDVSIEEEGDTPGFDVVIEATGAAQCIQTGIHALRDGGTFIQTGLSSGDVSIPINTLSMKEVVVRGCFRYGAGDFKLAVELAVSGAIGMKRFITKIMPFEEVTEAWETVRRGEGIKTLIKGVGG